MPGKPQPQLMAKMEISLTLTLQFQLLELSLSSKIHWPQLLENVQQEKAPALRELKVLLLKVPKVLLLEEIPALLLMETQAEVLPPHLSETYINCYKSMSGDSTPFEKS